MLQSSLARMFFIIRKDTSMDTMWCLLRKGDLIYIKTLRLIPMILDIACGIGWKGRCQYYTATGD